MGRLTEKRIKDAMEELNRYGGYPDNRLVGVLEALAELNDDLCHDRAPDVIQGAVNNVVQALGKVKG